MIRSTIWYQNAETILAYAAIFPEPDLQVILQEILDQGKTLLLPRCEDAENMTARVIRDLAELVPGAFSIPEPDSGAQIMEPEKIDLILVPGMAFDPYGGRLGKGKGYYDRFLTGLQVKTMGICGALLPRIPMEEHDLRMDAVVTAKEVYFR